MSECEKFGTFYCQECPERNRSCPIDLSVSPGFYLRPHTVPLGIRRAKPQEAQKGGLKTIGIPGNGVRGTG